MEYKKLVFGILLLCTVVFLEGVKGRNKAGQNIKADCSCKISAEVTTGEKVPVTSKNNYLNYYLVDKPTNLKPGQGWGLLYESTYTMDYMFFYLTEKGKDGNLTKCPNQDCPSTLFFDEDYQWDPPTTKMFTLLPCTAEFNQYQNVEKWVVNIEYEPATYDGYLHTVAIDPPVLKELGFGEWSGASTRLSPSYYKFTTTSTSESLYFFIQFSSRKGQTGGFEEGTVTIYEKPCDGQVYYSYIIPYVEANVRVKPNTDYYVYINPTGFNEENFDAILYMNSSKCGVSCVQSQGGVCDGNKCNCKQGYYGSSCEFLSCNSVEIKYPCQCTPQYEVTSGTPVSVAPNTSFSFYSFKTKDNGATGSGWLLDFNLKQQLNYLDRNFFVAPTDQGGINLCPRFSGAPVLNIIVPGYLSAQTGFKPCLPLFEAYHSHTSWVLTIGNGISAAVSLVELAPPVALAVKFGANYSAVASTWTPSVFSFDVPAGVTQLQFYGSFQNFQYSGTFIFYRTSSFCEFANSYRQPINLGYFGEAVFTFPVIPNSKNFIVIDTDLLFNNFVFNFVLSTK